MSRLCPVCGSSDTGGTPLRQKQYTDRGRMDTDAWYCHQCKSRWTIYDYVREDVEEIKDVRLANGDRQAWSERRPPTCLGCKSEHATFIQHDGPWRGWETETLRYQCAACGEIWQEMVRVEDGSRLARRLWRKGQIL